MSGESLNEYSIWLEPEGITRRRLKKIISSLSDQNGTVPFEPHITLLGGLMSAPKIIIKKIEELAQRHSPITLTLRSAGHTNNYYQAIFFKCVRNPNLTKLNREAKIFLSKSSPYRPHLSLVYGELPKNQREKILSDIKKISLVNLTFTVKSLSLWQAKGPVKKWRRLAIRKFKGKRNPQD